MARLRLSLLGPPDVRHGDRTVTFATRKTLALLAFLATESGDHTRERLTALLWPESDQNRGGASLRRTLAYLRDALDERGGEPHVIAAAGRLRLAGECEFDLNLVRTSLVGPPDATRLAAAAAAVRGEFLEGLSLYDSEEFDAWASLERETWHSRVLQVFNVLSDVLAESGDTVGGLEIANRWIELEPLDEQAHRRLMQIHLVRGDRSGALRVYQACRRLLAVELGSEPDEATQALHERARAAVTPVAWPSPAPPEPAAEAPMVGRGLEHRRLVSALRSAGAGSPRIAIIEGESGIGKSRLVREYSTWAVSAGAAVFQSRADGVAAGLPYQAICDALRSKVLPMPDPRSLLGDVWLSELVQLMPDLAERCPGLPLPIGGAGARLRLFEAATRVVESIAGRQPALLVLEDMHWADASTRDLVAYAVRRWAEHGTAVLLVLTVRTDDPDLIDTTLKWLADLERAAPVERITLDGLDLASTQELVRLWPGATNLEQYVEQLHHDTGGRPLLLTERLRYVQEGGTLDDVAPGVQQIIRARMLRLSRAGRDLASAAATLGREMSFELLSQVAQVDERRALDALEELLGRRVLQATAAGYELSHADLQRVVYADLQQERRFSLHRRALRALDGLAAPAELLRHALAAGERAAGRTHGIAAGRSALTMFATREAIAHFNAAFAIDDTPDSAHLDLARALELVEDASAAANVYRHVSTGALAAGDHLLVARALAAWAVLEAQAMRLDRALELASEATTEAAASNDQSAAVEAALTGALIHTYATDLDAALDRALSAVELARNTHSVALVARSLNTVAFTRQLRGDWDTVEAPAAEAAELFEAIGERAMHVDSRCYVAAAHIAQGRHASGVAVARQALVASRAIDNAWGIAHSGHHLAWGLLDAGAYAELIGVCAEAIAAAREIRFTPLLCLNLVVAGAAQRAIGYPEHALELHRETLALGRTLGGLSRELAAGELCADLVALGDWEGAAEAALEARTARTSARMYADLTRPAQTQALLHAGLADTAPESLPGERYRIPILHVRSILAENGGGSGDSGTHDLETAADIAQRLALPGEEWPMRVRLARLYAGLGIRSAAQAHWTCARDILRQLIGALPAELSDGLGRVLVDLERASAAWERAKQGS